jgi:anaerobic selenocysteine-containing dehydrogenase
MDQSVNSWKPTACILCSRNCGIEVVVRGREMTRVRGDKAHPISEGYLCQKAQRLNFYQNHSDRLASPLRRRDDGAFEPVPWETAIAEIAARLVALRETHGGESLAYFGGGGQGNHLAGPYAKALRTAMQTRNYYSALARTATRPKTSNTRTWSSSSAPIPGNRTAFGTPASCCTGFTKTPTAK